MSGAWRTPPSLVKAASASEQDGTWPAARKVSITSRPASTPPAPVIDAGVDHRVDVQAEQNQGSVEAQPCWRQMPNRLPTRSIRDQASTLIHAASASRPAWSASLAARRVRAPVRSRPIRPAYAQAAEQARAVDRQGSGSAEQSRLGSTLGDEDQRPAGGIEVEPGGGIRGQGDGEPGKPVAPEAVVRRPPSSCSMDTAAASDVSGTATALAP
ncbi:MAG: hypothetical protein U1E17_04145 [Geminicoccaceae bacterium]